MKKNDTSKMNYQQNRKKRLFLRIAGPPKSSLHKILGFLLLGVWTIINILLYIKSSKLAGPGNSYKFFFPFNYRYSENCLWAYDMFEFVAYTILLPIGIILMIRYALLYHEGKQRNRLVRYICLFIAVCFSFAAAAFTDNSAVIELLFSAVKGGVGFLISYYFARYVFRGLSK